MKPTVNKKAYFNYEILEKIEAGIVLTGNEIKQIRSGKISLGESFVFLKDGEAYLQNAHIPVYEKGTSGAYDPTRNRKLLLKKDQIEFLLGKLAGSNLTIIPTKLYFKRGFAKIEVALARGKKKYDKREAIKKKEQQREAARYLRKEKLK